ncbi:hypothetical protein GCM10011581_39490 [Saccharopolyspora subtropica]|uniref:Uncharacterized protein n=1 Tax=Saccharopolyspora thermophila TaxID=89367 RepID=A0A917NHH4_9PSEU|nr:hypothetical protein [Saccharopolyspora subtropica]GGI98435.1 hypothetical protein GCM10011581_39490 [Saccharopolyspora subtropica]
MSERTRGLATLLRRTQWLLDDLAFHVGSGRLDAGEFEEASAALEEIVLLLKENRPEPERTA